MKSLRVHIGVLELRSVVAANLLDLHLKLILGLPGKVLKDLLDLRFIIEKEHPSKSRKIVNNDQSERVTESATIPRWFW